ncbi:MAG: class I SAM-dependent methyltransferase [Thermoplasmata archaeon]|nr:class I SAM-dependent methyltransferase [Thermoplasmata archaeon]
MDLWDRQQTRYIPHREARFEAMFDTLESQFGGRFTVVDLGCGPGSLSARLLRRFPRIRVVAVDYDPVLLYLGRQTLRSASGRLRWVEADLRAPAWRERLPRGRPDAVVSTTALHWLPFVRLRKLYAELARLLPAGGLFLDGDHRLLDRSLPQLGRIARDASRLARRSPRGTDQALGWTEWWEKLRAEPRLTALFELRAARYPERGHHEHSATVGAQRSWLHRAGFREAAPVWQQFDDFVLAAVR